MDVDTCCNIAGNITPVPGGTGMLSSIMLLQNTMKAMILQENMLPLYEKMGGKLSYISVTSQSLLKGTYLRVSSLSSSLALEIVHLSLSPIVFWDYTRRKQLDDNSEWQVPTPST